MLNTELMETSGASFATRRAWLRSALAAGAAVSGMGAWAGAAADGSNVGSAGSFNALVRSKAAQSPCLGVVQVGQRLVAVGERGHVLLSDDQGQQWRQASEVPTRTTLTAVCNAGRHGVFAVGHGAVLLHSSDGGEHWRIRHGRPDALINDALLSVYVDEQGRGLAGGSYGFALRTTDGGQQWTPVTLIEGEEGERHLNQIVDVGQGVWLIAAEEGRVLRSEDHGEHWTALTTPYGGSLWSGAVVAPRTVVMGGMRGNVLHSQDAGVTWKLRQVTGAGSLTAVIGDGRAKVALLGLDGTLALSDDLGGEFKLRSTRDRLNYTSGVFLSDGSIVAGSAEGPRRLPTSF